MQPPNMDSSNVFSVGSGFDATLAPKNSPSQPPDSQQGSESSKGTTVEVPPMMNRGEEMVRHETWG